MANYIVAQAFKNERVFSLYPKIVGKLILVGINVRKEYAPFEINLLMVVEARSRENRKASSRCKRKLEMQHEFP